MVMLQRRVGNAQHMQRKLLVRFAATGGLLILVVMSVLVGTDRSPVRAQSADWPTYMGNDGRSGFNGAETTINQTTAPHLKLHWKQKAAGAVTTQPVEANGLVYWGSWDGLEHATIPTTGQDLWTANLGMTTVTCSNIHHGVLSTAEVASISLNGVMTPVVFVGGGNVVFYALNANTGAIIWQTPLGTQPDYFLYGSPAVFDGSVYIGVSSHGDCPLVQGQLVQLDAATGAIQHTFNMVPTGCIGGSVWVAPAIDAQTQILYIATGNEGTCSTNETMTDAIVELHATDLSFINSWQVPPPQQIVDGDFGSTPTLFDATISGVVHHMVGLVNKNGMYYALDRTNLSAGPLWQVRLAAPPGSGGDSIASSAWDGSTLYAAAARTTINKKNCAGSLRALNPATGKFIWQDCLSSDVLSPVTVVPGLAVAGGGTSFIIVNAQTGKQLFHFLDTLKGSNFLGPASISNGILYQGNKDGYLYALGT